VRGETFVTRKITRAASTIALGLQANLYLGILYAKRDWGHAKDYVKMMWLLLQADEPEDWVIATGETTTVRDFVKMAFAYAGIELAFKGEGIDEKGYIKSIDTERMKALGLDTEHLTLNAVLVEVDEKYFRPTEVDLLLGDPTKAEQKLGWKREYKLEELVNEMMASDLKLMTKDQYLKEGGYTIMNYFE
jgi:GDPmannose 4,6-dehydratase